MRWERCDDGSGGGFEEVSVAPSEDRDLASLRSELGHRQDALASFTGRLVSGGFGDLVLTVGVEGRTRTRKLHMRCISWRKYDPEKWSGIALVHSLVEQTGDHIVRDKRCFP